ncbi:capsid protein [Enterococcus cecorum]|uniref:minor capsid protein n=1 Tax=Enterococcus cecorum TaxID=44008 RepID=UPI000AD7237C|nr:minor capsid protein [Enterococcus cecorum]MCJ0522268.1 minor capsid protein [Enterococcus cecorum]MCJ0535951.1 minor capsid protein [Enterococcus cecorum]MCJ0554948.1 minor capsid protein [Enterococcus cecorum]MCJ0559075.1 minor capsid protein [Enterococcus cecorum]MCJ0600181.1 minor capsid protein [Enterococcus cecorum]
MGSEITVNVDLKGIEKKVSPQAFARGQLALASQMMDDMERFVPKLSGDLRASAILEKDGVTYDTPYARAQFYGSGYTKKASFTFRRYTTSGTGKRWDLRASAIYMSDWEKKALEGMGVL